MKINELELRYFKILSSTNGLSDKATFIEALKMFLNVIGVTPENREKLIAINELQPASKSITIETNLTEKQKVTLIMVQSTKSRKEIFEKIIGIYAGYLTLNRESQSQVNSLLSEN